MKFKVETTRADYDAFFAHTVAKGLRFYVWIPMLKTALIWFALAFSFMSFFRFRSGDVEKELFFSVLTLSIAFLAYGALSKFIETKIARFLVPNENGIMIGTKEIEISPEGIKEIHSYGYNFYNWDVVEKVEEVNGSIYVFVDKVLGLIFNPESLKSDEFKQEILATFHKYQKQAT